MENVEVEVFHINSRNEFSDFLVTGYNSLQHELMHFMNAIDDFNGFGAAKNCNSYKIIDIIKNKGTVSKLEISNEEDCSDNGKATQEDFLELLGKLYEGHCIFKHTSRIDDDNEKSPLKTEVLKTLNEKTGIYNFYFEKGKTLRELIGK